MEHQVQRQQIQISIRLVQLVQQFQIDRNLVQHHRRIEVFSVSGGCLPSPPAPLPQGAAFLFGGSPRWRSLSVRRYKRTTRQRGARAGGEGGVRASSLRTKRLEIRNANQLGITRSLSTKIFVHYLSFTIYMKLLLNTIGNSLLIFNLVLIIQPSQARSLNSTQVKSNHITQTTGAELFQKGATAYQASQLKDAVRYWLQALKSFQSARDDRGIHGS